METRKMKQSMRKKPPKKKVIIKTKNKIKNEFKI